MNIVRSLQLYNEDEMLVSKQNALSYYLSRVLITFLGIIFLGSLSSYFKEHTDLRIDFGVLIASIYMISQLIFKRIYLPLTIITSILMFLAGSLFSILYFNAIYPTIPYHNAGFFTQHHADIITALGLPLLTIISTIFLFKKIFKLKFLWEKGLS